MKGVVVMSTLEATVSMLEALPEEALLHIQSYVKFLFYSQPNTNPFPVLTREQLMNDLAVSRSHFEQGLYEDAQAVYDDLVKKYDL